MPGTTQFVFAEPYTPEEGEFHPTLAPMSMNFEFADVCTGPPWPITKVEPIKPRKENMEITMSWNEESDILFGIIPSEQSPGGIDTEFAAMLLSMMKPEAEVLKYAQAFTYLKISGVMVPMTYVRTKIAPCFRDYYLDARSATHTLRLTSTNRQPFFLPVHDIVLVTQCLRVHKLARLQTNHRKLLKVKPVLHVEGVPHIDSFWILLKWLYSNDEDELYEALEQSCLEGNEMLFGFVENCRFWGVIDSRVFGVVKALVEEKFGADSP